MPYSRAELISAFRAENPDAKDIPDNKIFAAIAVEDPDLAKGISELQGGNPQGKATPVPWYTGLFNRGNPSSPASQGLEEAANRTEKARDILMNTAPGAETLQGGPTKIPGLDIIRNALNSATPSAPNIPELGAPTTAAMVTRPTFKQAVVASPGVQALKAITPDVIQNLPRSTAEALTTPESLMKRAAANRAAYAEAPSVIDTVDVTKPLSVFRAANTVTRPARGSVQEKLAQWMAQGQPIGQAEIAADEASRIASTVGAPREDLIPQEKLNIPRPSVPAFVNSQLETARNAETPEQTFQRFRAQQNADLPASQLSTGGPINAERPGPPSFLQEDLDAFQAAHAAGQKVNSAEVNKWMNVPAKEVLHGSNPGKQLIDEGLLGATKEATKDNVDRALDQAGKQMQSQLEAATSKGVTIDAQTPVYDAVAGATKKIGTPKDSTFQAQMNGIVDDIESKYPNLGKLSPSDTHKLKVELGDAISWSGAKYDDPANQALIQIYRKLNTSIKDGVEGIDKTQSRWGNLYAASKNLKNSLARDTVGTGTGVQPISKNQ